MIGVLLVAGAATVLWSAVGLVCKTARERGTL